MKRPAKPKPGYRAKPVLLLLCVLLRQYRQAGSYLNK